MPSRLFFELDEQKQERIICESIVEFADHGYINASTNRIVKSCGISKGSLFKYFSNKEDLYFFLLDTITTELIDSLREQTRKLSQDLFQRVIEYSTLEFSWYIRHPERGKLIIRSFQKSDTDIYRKTIERYKLKELNTFYSLIEDVDFNNIALDKDRTVDIFQWVLRGFNEIFLEKDLLETYSYEDIQAMYLKELTEYMEVLKKGMMK